MDDAHSRLEALDTELVRSLPKGADELERATGAAPLSKLRPGGSCADEYETREKSRQRRYRLRAQATRIMPAKLPKPQSLR